MNPGELDFSQSGRQVEIQSVALVEHFRSANYADITLVQRSALMRASRRTATSEVVPAVILRDARQEARSSG
jgi:hypothetical protein